jgi:hypothetical protein
VSDIVSWLALTKVAAWVTPLNVTVDDARNPVPLIVSLCAADPATTEVGLSCVIVGTGLLKGGVTVNESVFEVVPVTLEFVTATEFGPAVPRRLAGNKAVNDVGSEYAVGRGEPLNAA